jgi:hypothetical protein
MGLFPSEAEVRRRRRDRNMLYTEPDDDSEPRGTNEEKTAEKSTRKSTRKVRRKWGLEDTRDMQRIEDEMDDEPILSAVLTASAARKPRGDKNSRNAKNSKKDTRKGEGRSREEDGSRDEKRRKDKGHAPPGAPVGETAGVVSKGVAPAG